MPELRLINRGVLAVLIAEGEELSGTKQNRAVNVSILVAAKCELVITVSCPEQGWGPYRSDKFSSGEKVMHASLRRAAPDSISFSPRHGDGFSFDQGRVCGEVACKH